MENFTSPIPVSMNRPNKARPLVALKRIKPMSFPFDIKYAICQFATGSFEDPLGEFDVCTYTTSDAEERRKELEDFAHTETPAVIAARLCLISKDWNEAAHKLLFYQINFRDHSFPIRGRNGTDVLFPSSDQIGNRSKQWLAVAKRLSQPVQSRIFREDPNDVQLAGHFVKRLYVYSRNYGDSHQLAIILAMVKCPNITSIIFAGPVTFPYLFRLPRSSYLMQSLLGITQLRPNKLRTAILTLPVDPLAVPGMLKAMSLCPELETLMIRQDSALGDNYYFRGLGLFFPSLKNFIIDSRYGGDIAYFDIMARAHTPKLSSFVMSGRGNLKDMETFLQSKAGTLKTVVANYYGFDDIGMPSLPDSAVIEQIVVTYPHAVQFLQGTYKHCKLVGLSGPKLTNAVFGEPCIDPEELRATLEILANITKFPALSRIQLMDIQNADLIGSPWQIVDSTAWEDVVQRLRGVDEKFKSKRQVELFDSENEQLVYAGFDQAHTPSIQIGTAAQLMAVHDMMGGGGEDDINFDGSDDGFLGDEEDDGEDEDGEIWQGFEDAFIEDIDGPDNGLVATGTPIEGEHTDDAEYMANGSGDDEDGNKENEYMTGDDSDDDRGEVGDNSMAELMEEIFGPFDNDLD
ncbi:hypothetical protein SCHPADRAFT_935737 [Schizopora paradoxa]|uniref:Uncharacterized protein n=1 Tax=Schizopora paradoxa TaxID=27342 RepID=A0A0H2SPB0_9AGAM|nr:hypothetical protein SCHPADRAFT_935737 [Schizopora paradoxa]